MKKLSFKFQGIDGKRVAVMAKPDEEYEETRERLIVKIAGKDGWFIQNSGLPLGYGTMVKRGGCVVGCGCFSHTEDEWKEEQE